MALSSLIEYVQALDTSATDGSGKTALTSGDITAKYLTQAGTLTSLTTETITTLGTYQAPTSAAHIRIKELANTDPTKGIYEVHLHNGIVAASGRRLRLFFSATGARFIPLAIDLLANEVESINQVSTSSVTAVNANIGTTQPTNFTGTGATAYVKSSLWDILGTVLTETTGGWITAAFKKLFNVATPTGTVNSLPDAAPGAANGVAIVGSAMTLSAAYDAAKTAATQASVDDLPTNAELATALAAADDAILTQVALVKASTDNIPSDPADASDIATAFGTVNTTLATLGTYIDTEVAAVKVVTDKLASMIQASGLVWQFTTDSLENGPGGGAEFNFMPVSGAATIGNVLEGGRIIGQFGAPLVGLTITCTTTSAGVTSARDLTSYAGNLSLVVFDNDETAAVSSRVVQGANITVSSNVATVSSTASSALNTVVSSELRWELRETGAAPSIVFAKGAYVCERAPLSTG